jgi:tripartite-type tricarboxylate transporter receptor subunit TctC
MTVLNYRSSPLARSSAVMTHRRRAGGLSQPLGPAECPGAGGVADWHAHPDGAADGCSKAFVVENRPGGGIVGWRRQRLGGAGQLHPADDRQLHAISAGLFKALPYDILTDFAPTSTVSFFDLLIVTRAGSPLASAQDIVKAARTDPGRLNVSTTNPGSTQNLAAELFRSVTGIAVTIVPFRTSPDMATALLRGDVDVAFEFYAAMQGLINDNKVRVLASTGPQRTSYLSDVPTVQESGIKDFEVVSWNGISVPAATPKPVIEVLTRAINGVLPRPEVREKAAKLGMEMRASTPEAMTERMKTDIAKWAAVIDKAGIPKHE